MSSPWASSPNEAGCRTQGATRSSRRCHSASRSAAARRCARASRTRAPRARHSRFGGGPRAMRNEEEPEVRELQSFRAAELGWRWAPQGVPARAGPPWSPGRALEAGAWGSDLSTPGRRRGHVAWARWRSLRSWRTSHATAPSLSMASVASGWDNTNSRQEPSSYSDTIDISIKSYSLNIHKHKY